MATGTAGGNTLESLWSELNNGEVSFNFLRDITKRFSEERKLGTGAHGTVYRGVLKDGVIAVKKHLADAPGTGNKEAYGNMIRSIMEHKHGNVVNLLAFCHERRNEVVLSARGRKVSQEVVESLLCYEYFPKGSLHNNLFVEHANIDWNTRLKIIKGICEGLRFLHTLPQPIIHLNLKPQNIMLDDNMVPKIADFGYSRIVDPTKTRINTQSSVGSDGYMAPEYIDKTVNEISTRFDIYSLGLMMIEIATREKNCPSDNQKSARKFIKKVKADWTNKERILAEYGDLDDGCLHQLNGCIEIGLDCVDLNQNKRPKIVEIVNRLNGY